MLGIVVIIVVVHSVVSDSLWPHGLQHTRLLCPSLSPRVHSNSCLLSWWYHPTISSPSPPALNVSQQMGLFPMCWLFASGDQSIRASASVLPMSIQGLFPLGLTGLISLLSKRFSRVFSSTTVWKHQFFSVQSFLWSNSHIHTWLLKES